VVPNVLILVVDMVVVEEMLTNLEDLLAVVMESMETFLQMVLTSKQIMVYGTPVLVAVAVAKAPDLWMVVLEDQDWFS
jgi:hypothetical protein